MAIQPAHLGAIETVLTEPPGGKKGGSLETKIMDLGTSDVEILKMVRDTMSGGSTAEQQLLMHALGMRNTMVNTLSTMLRQILDGKNAIVRNLRA